MRQLYRQEFVNPCAGQVYGLNNQTPLSSGFCLKPVSCVDKGLDRTQRQAFNNNRRFFLLLDLKPFSDLLEDVFALIVTQMQRSEYLDDFFDYY